MLEMNGFNPKITEAEWKAKIDSHLVKTEMDLFLLGYDIMRLNYRNLTGTPATQQVLSLDPDDSLHLLYADYPSAQSDELTIRLYRGPQTEVFVLPRDLPTDCIVEAHLELEGYQPMLWRRKLKEAFEYMETAEESDIKDMAATIWRGHLAISR